MAPTVGNRVPRWHPSFSLTSLVISLTIACHAEAQVRTITTGAGGVNHVEPHLAGNPRNPNELVVAAMAVRGVDPIGWTVHAFWSGDGGLSWSASSLPTSAGVGCAGDVWLFWGRARNVYLSCMAAVPSQANHGFNFRIWLHVSHDGGRTWTGPVEVATDPVGEWDHPVLIGAPGSPSARRDTIYIVATRPRRDANGFGIVRFIEGDSQFARPHWYYPPERRNDNLGGAVALGGERVLFTYFAMLQEPPRSLYAVVIEGDSVRRHMIRGNVLPWGFPMLTVRHDDGNSQVYGAWLESAGTNDLDVVLGWSRDYGATWRWRRVTEAEPGRFRARPAVATSPGGSIAVTWFEGDQPSPCGRVVLAVADSAESPFRTVFRREIAGAACTSITEPQLAAVANRWRAGGDYSGVSASTAGVFDLVWAEMGDDGFQIRFTRVRQY